MSLSRRPLVLLSAAALIAGCGGASSSDNPGPAQTSAPKTAGNGELKVGVTGGGIGTATTGGKGGLKVLPNGTVKGSSHTRDGVGAGASCQNTDIAPTQEALPTVVASTLCLLNGERADAGLGPLTQNPKLASAAAAHSEEMVDKQYFDHVGKDGTDPVDRIRGAGYIPSVGAWTVGENLAWGTGTLATPKEIVAAWMKSTGHRENILRPAFKEIGFGVVVGNPRSASGNGATYTTTFGGVTTAAKKARKAKRSRRSARRARTSKKARASANKTTKPSGSKKAPKPSGSKKATKPSGSH